MMSGVQFDLGGKPALNAAAGQGGSDESAAPLVARPLRLAFWIVTSLFLMWAIANNFNDILIKQFQKALQLSRLQSGLVQTAFYFGYFTIALPAGWAMKRVGYKNGVLIGLGLYALGAALFYPAAEVRQFGFFLVALYVIAAGLAFLETAANPLIATMGPSQTAAQRLNLAQSFNGLGASVAPFIGGALIFSGVEHGAQQLAAMTPSALEAWRSAEAHAVQLPYLGLAVIVLLLGWLVWRVPFPRLEEGGTERATATQPIWSVPHLRRAVLAQFFYVGAQVSVWSYFINFTQDVLGVGEKSAANYLGVSLFAFMIGRFVGTALLRFVGAPPLLSVYGIIGALLCGVSALTHGWLAVIALGMTSFFMSIMFPTIFALGVGGLGERTKLGSSLLIMSIIGGALFPPLVGLIADRSHSIQLAMGVPLVSFVVVAGFGRYMARVGLTGLHL